MAGPARTDFRPNPRHVAQAWTAQQRFNDSVLLSFGTTDGTDADLFHDGVDFNLVINAGDLLLTIAGGDLKLQQATIVSTTAGDLTLSPNADLILNDGLNFIGDTLNGDMTVGLTINMGAGSGQILALKSSDIQHGHLQRAETDTFCLIQKNSQTLGGVQMVFMAEDDALGSVLDLIVSGGTATTTKTAAGRALAEIIMEGHDGANNLAAVTANGNIFAVRAYTGSYETKFLVDEDGDTYQAGDIWGMGAMSVSTVSGDLTLSPNADLILNNGLNFIGDTANAKMTVGLTINMGANDNEALALKSSDVAHGMTNLAETDTYAKFAKISGATGGLQIEGYSDLNTYAMWFRAVGVTDNTTKSISGQAPLVLQAANANGVDIQDVGSNGNLAIIRNRDTTRFIFDAEGSGHADVEWVAYADHDDLALITEIEQHLLGVESEAGTYNRHMLEATGIIGKDSWHMEDGKPRAMVNTTKLSMLHHGALMQVGQRLVDLEEKLALAESKLAAIGA